MQTLLSNTTNSAHPHEWRTWISPIASLLNSSTSSINLCWASFLITLSFFQMYLHVLGPGLLTWPFFMPYNFTDGILCCLNCIFSLLVLYLTDSGVQILEYSHHLSFTLLDNIMFVFYSYKWPPRRLNDLHSIVQMLLQSWKMRGIPVKKWQGFTSLMDIVFHHWNDIQGLPWPCISLRLRG